LSNISIIYDGMVDLVSATLPTYTRLPDSYGVGGNNDINLNQGFSVGFSSGENTNRQICDKISIARIFNVRFTKLRAFTGIEFSEDNQHLIINSVISAEYFE